MGLQLVSFEQATALKELGFPQETDSWNYYDIEGKCVPYLQKGNHKEYCCDAPSLDLVAKWLREEKNFFMSLEYHPSCKSWDNFYEYKTLYDYIHNNKADYWDSYEEALSAGIDKAIEILKQQ